MNDALLDIRRTDIFDTKFRCIPFQRSKLLGAFRVHYGNTIAIGIHARGRRQVMIRHRQGEIGTTHLAAGKTKPLKCLRTRHFMNEMPVDIDKASAIIAAIHDMGIPDFRSEEHTSELQSLMRISYAVFCLKKKKTDKYTTQNTKERYRKPI